MARSTWLYTMPVVSLGVSVLRVGEVGGFDPSHEQCAPSRNGEAGDSQVELKD